MDNVIRNKHNLNYNENGSKCQYIKCPWCSDDRHKKNTKPLRIDLNQRSLYCNHCHKAGYLDGYEPKKDRTYIKPDRTKWSKFTDVVQQALFARGFSLETIQGNKIIQREFYDQDVKQNKVFIGYPYINHEAVAINMKWRCATEKAFRQETGAMPYMYNLRYWKDADSVIICEGENDVMAFNEAGYWNATTLNGGAINENDKNVDGKLEGFYNCAEFFDNKTIVYMATDNDGPGRRLRDELTRRIGAFRVRFITFPDGCKDANDVLLIDGLAAIEKGRETLKKCVENAKEVPIGGVNYLQDEMEIMLETFRSGETMGDTTYMGDLDTNFRWKRGELNVWTGYMNHGKTTFFLQAAMTKSILDGWKWGIFSPENYPAREFYNDIIEMYAGGHVHNQYHRKISEAQYIEACNFINDHFFFVYPDEKHTIEALHLSFRQLLIKHGIDGVLIDPHNQLESSFPGKRTDEEISEFMRTVKRFAVETAVSYNVVAHPKNPQKLKDRTELPPPDVRDINGGAMWGNKADNIVVVHRPRWFSDHKDSSVQVVIEKIKRPRTGGTRGGESMFHYDYLKARYHQNGVYFCDPGRKFHTKQMVPVQIPFEQFTAEPQPHQIFKDRHVTDDEQLPF